jgi:hypothetical protein
MIDIGLSDSLSAGFGCSQARNSFRTLSELLVEVVELLLLELESLLVSLALEDEKWW